MRGAEIFMWGTFFGGFLMTLAVLLIWVGYCIGKEPRKDG